MGRRLMAALAWLDDHWLGDLIGVVCLFAMLAEFLFIVLLFGPAP